MVFGEKLRKEKTQKRIRFVSVRRDDNSVNRVFNFSNFSSNAFETELLHYLQFSFFPLTIKYPMYDDETVCPMFVHLCSAKTVVFN